MNLKVSQRVGRRVGNWVIVAVAPDLKTNNRFLCRCVCGRATRLVLSSTLTRIARGVCPRGTPAHSCGYCAEDAARVQPRECPVCGHRKRLERPFCFVCTALAARKG